MEERAEEAFAHLERLGDGSMLEGVLRGVETGWFTREIAEASFDEQRRFERGELAQVGVNRFVEDDEARVPVLEIPFSTELAQREAVVATRRRRDAGHARAAIDALVAAARDADADLIEPLVDCARARCTEGEVVEALRDVFGSWREAASF
jgi:methylmalonyl-CoA mutase N-terminal domain/subunit